MRTLGLDAARRNGVNSDFSRSQFLGEPPRYCIHGAFAARIHRGLRCSCACNRTHVDDAAAIRPEILYRLSYGENRPEHVDVEVLMELILGDLFQPCEPVDAGIVHQDIHPAECLLGFLEQPHHVVRFGDVALDCNGLTAFRFDVSDNPVRVLLAGGIIHDHCGACGAQGFGDRRADAL